MNKRKLSILFLCFYLAAMLLSLTSCGGGGGSIRGFYADGYMSDKRYNEQTGITSLRVDVEVTNENTSRDISSYKYKVVFKSESGAVLSTRVYSAYDPLSPYDTEVFTYHFEESDGSAIRGNVARVEVYPTEMTMSNEKTSASGESAWGFWAWFWTIVSGILVLLFITCCIGADGDTDAIIGGVVIFLAPAILILVIYFGFVYGSGL